MNIAVQKTNQIITPTHANKSATISDPTIYVSNAICTLYLAVGVSQITK